MVIFINDIPLHLIEELPRSRAFHATEIEGPVSESLFLKQKGDILLKKRTPKDIELLIETMEAQKFKNIHGIYLLVPDIKYTMQIIKSHFKIVKAAGGIVEKEDKILMIFRMGKWDLPKGKIDKGEAIEDCALREVEEECGIRVERHQLICKSWHTYLRNNRRHLKKTYWYRMSIVDDSQMKPQEDEDIQEVRWMVDKELRAALYNTYRSVRWIMRQYYARSDG